MCFHFAVTDPHGKARKLKNQTEMVGETRRAHFLALYIGRFSQEAALLNNVNKKGESLVVSGGLGRKG